MNILAVADHEAKYYYDYYTPGRLKEFDLILSRCPVLYVHGNHDDRLDRQPPEGCICIEDQIYVHNGVRILGLGGSFRYNVEGKYMYSERQMATRIRRLRFQLWKHKGFDILLTHAPAYQINDLDTVAHRGFESFRGLLDKYQPKYFVHGHVHRGYGRQIPRTSSYGATTVINADEYCKFQLDEPQ